MDRLAWKHSRQNTGRPCVGRKGTVVSLPHCEHVVLVSARACVDPPPPPPSARLALHALQRFGSFLNPLSAKNICSPAVNTNSAPHSEHFRTLSWYSMSRSPSTPAGSGDGLILHQGLFLNLDLYSGNAGHGSLGPVDAVNVRTPKTSLPDRGLIPEVRRRAASRSGS